MAENTDIIQVDQEVTNKQPHTARIGDKLYNVDLLIKQSEELPALTIQTQSLQEYQNGNFWEDSQGEPIGPHTILSLVHTPGPQNWEELAKQHPQYSRDLLKTGRADYKYPVLVVGDDLVIDGMHRLTKAWAEGVNEIGIKRFVSLPASAIIDENTQNLEK